MTYEEQALRINQGNLRKANESFDPTKPHSAALVGIGLCALNLKTVCLALDRLNDRIKEIEAKGVVYRGVWQAADEYKRGDLATLDGSIWHCNADTRDKPGNGRTWTLAVKAGRDAR